MTRAILHGLITLALVAALPATSVSGSDARETAKPNSLLGLGARRLDGTSESLERY
jgi:hypothetical protein